MLGEYVNGLGPDDLVFTTPQGDVLRESNFRGIKAHQPALIGIVRESRTCCGRRRCR